MEDPKSKLHERDSYGYTDDGLLYHISRENGKEYKATVVPQVLIETVLKEMHDHFGHFGVGKTYALIKRYYYWPKMIRNIQAHVESCSLCRREKLQADKYQLQTTEIPLKSFAKVSINLVVDLPTSHDGNKNILSNLNFLCNRIDFFQAQAFASPTDMASSSVKENIILAITPTFDGVCGMLLYIILNFVFCQI